jgi:hypothetical protein
MDMKYVASVSLLAFLSTGHAMAQALDVPRPPTATGFQATIPEHGSFSTSRTVKGYDAVRQLREETGLDVADLASFDVADPLLTNNASLEAKIRHGGSTTRTGARTAFAPGGTARNTIGDTITQAWAADGWSYASTHAWNGTQWDLTFFSKRRDAVREP